MQWNKNYAPYTATLVLNNTSLFIFPLYSNTVIQMGYSNLLGLMSQCNKKNYNFQVNINICKWFEIVFMVNIK